MLQQRPFKPTKKGQDHQLDLVNEQLPLRATESLEFLKYVEETRLKTFSPLSASNSFQFRPDFQCE